MILIAVADGASVSGAAGAFAETSLTVSDAMLQRRALRDDVARTLLASLFFALEHAGALRPPAPIAVATHAEGGHA